MQALSGDSLLVIVTTPSQLYVFLGGPGLTGLFAGYGSRSLGAFAGNLVFSRTSADACQCSSCKGC